MKATPTLRGTFSISSILDGSATVQLQDWTTGVSDSIKLTSIGTYTSAKETVTVKIVQSSAFPVLNSAINFRTGELDFNSSGTLSIDGRDHDINNVLLPPSSNDRCGASVSTSADTSELVPSHASQINGTSDVLVDAAIANPQTFAAGLISHADYTLTGTYTSPQTWGSPSSPKIVYCNGEVEFKGNCTGWGILLINGEEFESKGTFTFYGLVMFYNANDDEVEWETKCQMTIVGGLILSGSSEVEYKSEAQAYINYSKQALDLAKTRSSGGGGLAVSNWSD